MPNITAILFLVLFVWIGLLTFLLIKTINKYNRLTHGVTQKTLTDLLDEFIKQDKLTQQETNKMIQQMQKLKIEQLKFIQKIGLVRFNPFSDTGGDQSYSLALLDGEENGIVLTSLYARTGVRWYVKTIKKGRGLEHDLSKEEKAALDRAIKI